MEALECSYQSGPEKGQLKGLFAIALELGIQVSPSIKLNEIKSILSKHRAFQNVSKNQPLTL